MRAVEYERSSQITQMARMTQIAFFNNELNELHEYYDG